MSLPDPNARYKASFRALTEKLGRVPDSRDKEWLEMHEEYKKGWQSNEPRPSGTSTSYQDTKPVRESVGGHSLDGSHGPDRRGKAADRGSGGSAEQAVSAPGIIPTRPPDRTTGERANGAPRIDEGGMVASAEDGLPARGPNGGVLAVCSACGQEWERERRPGRPAAVCGECR